MAAADDSNLIRVIRDSKAIEALLNAPIPETADLYTLVPCGRGKSTTSKMRATVFPHPALPAAQLASVLQVWLQDEVFRHHETVHSQQHVQLGMVDPVPIIEVSAKDILSAALDGTFLNQDADAAYQRWCVKRFGVMIVRPTELYGWASETTDFWAPQTLQEAIRCEHNVHVTIEDMQHAADQEECRDHAAQSFFDAQAVRQAYLVTTTNLTSSELQRIEREGPYYTWEPIPQSEGEPALHVKPWEGVASGADFAYRLQHAFSTNQLLPALTYTSEGSDIRLPYITNPPVEPDEAMVKRLSRGEWATQCDAKWKFTVRQVPVYAWVIEPITAAATTRISKRRIANFPSPHDRFTIDEMAKDMTYYFHVEADADDVRHVINTGAPKLPAVRAEWNKLKAAVHALNCTVTIEEL